jgi:ubiquinone/menaquinone biosynthesis C-methylase UbiE
MHNKTNLIYSNGTFFDIILAYLLDGITLSERTPEEINYNREIAVEFMEITDLNIVSLLGQTTAISALNINGSYGRIVEIGCGPAKISIYLAEMLKRNNINDSDAEIIAVDKSQAMINLAKENIEKFELSGYINIVEASAYNLPFPDNSIDCIVMQDTLHEMSDPVQALREINRAVKEDGSFFIRDLRRPPGKLALNAMLRLFARKYNKPQKDLFSCSMKAGYTGTELRKLLKEAGIVDYRIRPASITHIDILKWGENSSLDYLRHAVNLYSSLRGKLQFRSYIVQNK